MNARAVMIIDDAQKSVTQQWFSIVRIINYTCKWRYFWLFGLSLPQNLMKLTAKQISVHRFMALRAAAGPLLVCTCVVDVNRKPPYNGKGKDGGPRIIGRQSNDYPFSKLYGWIKQMCRRARILNEYVHLSRAFRAVSITIYSSCARYLLLIRLSIRESCIVYSLINDSIHDNEREMMYLEVGCDRISPLVNKTQPPNFASYNATTKQITKYHYFSAHNRTSRLIK